jgi:hypothetical protein
VIATSATSAGAACMGFTSCYFGCCSKCLRLDVVAHVVAIALLAAMTI